ncbi:chromate efflux transporter [Terricaulis silvestris]|uniref:Chromate transport protein n=1 Tax=Terricaulis silvestris TaxID=2686094 RepID=A0A6I6MQF5_9CAUL|nr:chromate efflux transporter [Terricaulis silvestris]QGZ96939.1 Chromate transport protein [Terricaulis silvestris]
MNAAPLLSTLFRESLKVGCLGFGGPAGQIALMHRVFVDERNWIDDARFQRMLAFCMLLPGPEAQQLATYIGWRLRGWQGALIAGWLFVIPGALIVLALSWLYVSYGELPLVAAAFDGVKCAVVALVAEALVKVGKRALKTNTAIWIAIAAFVALILGAPFPLVIIAAGAIGALIPHPLAGEVRAKRGEGDAPLSQAATRPDSSPVRGGAYAHAILWLILWLAPPALIAVTLGTDHVLFQVALLFSILACVTFGGAYALLAYLATEAATRGWLTPAQMIDGLGLAETTPGPLILVNEFVGFLAGWTTGGLPLALTAAAIALWCTFAPSFVWIFAGAPIAERLEHNRHAAGALAAITAAVLGVIAKLALFFAAHALFTAQIHIGPVELPDPATARLWMVGLALAAGIALIRFKANLLLVLAACAIAGLAAHALAL